MRCGLVVFAKDVERLAAFYEACLPLERLVTERSHIEPIDKAWQIRDSTVLDGLDPEGNVIQFKQKNA